MMLQDISVFVLEEALTAGRYPPLLIDYCCTSLFPFFFFTQVYTYFSIAIYCYYYYHSSVTLILILLFVYLFIYLLIYGVYLWDRLNFFCCRPDPSLIERLFPWLCLPPEEPTDGCSSLEFGKSPDHVLLRVCSNRTSYA